jgi:protease secretion system membrane fusion protein
MTTPLLKKLFFHASRKDDALVPDMDEKRMMRIGAWILTVGFGGFLLWAAIAPLDQGVHGAGTIAVINERKSVQPLQGGLVDEVLVREGASVRKGQVLVRMNTVEAKAQREDAHAQYVTLKAMEARLLAELENKREVLFPADIFQQAGDAIAADAKTVQSALFRSRRNALENELSAIRENIAGQEYNFKGLEQSLAAKNEQIALIGRQLDGVRDLAVAGYFAKNRVLELERASYELKSAAESTKADIGQARSRIAEWKYKFSQRQQEDRKEVETALGGLQKEMAGAQSRLKALEFTLHNAELLSPADGVVVGLNAHTNGGVIPAGGVVMDIVPNNEPLIVEAKFSPSVVDKLRPKLPVDLHFLTLNHPDIPVVTGEVMTVSADQLDDPYSHTPYFLVRIEVGESELQKLREHKLEVQAGMPLDVLVRTGERSFLSYLLEPVKERLKWAFTEE